MIIPDTTEMIRDTIAIGTETVPMSTLAGAVIAAENGTRLYANGIL